MNRVTFENKDGTFGVNGICLNSAPPAVQNGFRKLVAYENTGLEPEQVGQIAEAYRRWQEDGEVLRRSLRI
jgi:hypothetical protein